jgi:hypothetical protein
MTNPVPARAAGPTWLDAVIRPPQAAEAAINWRAEGVVALLVAAYSAILGAAVGLVWPRVAPQVRVLHAAQGSEAALKALLGDDVWLGFLGIFAAAVCTAILAISARDAGRGPGGMVGLAVGGLLGSLVAVHIGHVVYGAQHPYLRAEVHNAFPSVPSDQVTHVLNVLRFTLRDKAALLAWPVAAVVLQAATVIVRSLRGADTTGYVARSH